MKKFHPFLILILLSFLVLPCVTASGAELTLDNAPAKVFFSPKGGCLKGIIKEIEMGTREILVQAYSFSSTPIRNALINAQKGGRKWKLSSTRMDKKIRITKPPKPSQKMGLPSILMETMPARTIK